MSQEVKFRAWDRKAGLMITDLQRDDGSNMAILATGKLVAPWPLMQYTGRKDKNDQEIYADHIVRLVADKPYSEHSGVGMIVFCDSDLQWQIQQAVYHDGGLPLTWGGWSSIEIIGDVHQNPELLPWNK